MCIQSAAQPLKPTSRRRRGEKGQVLLEFLINFIIFFFLLWALVEIALIASTKLLTNYASWAAARTWSVRVDEGDGMSDARQAATDVLKAMNWGPSVEANDSQSKFGRTGIYVDYRTTLGIPRFLTQSHSSTVTTRGFAPMIQETIRQGDEKGDNAGN